MSESTTDPYGPPNMLQRADETVLRILKSFGETVLKGSDMPRRDIAGRMQSVYCNRFGGLVNEQLMSWFALENFVDLRLATHTSTNVLERVVKETCIVYSEPASRYLKDDQDEEGARATAGGRIGELLTLPDAQLIDAPEGAPPTEGVDSAADTGEPAPGSEGTTGVETAEAGEADPFEAWLKASDLDTLWSEAHRLARFHPAVWVKPEVREAEDGQLAVRYDLYTPATADIIPSPRDATQAIAWYTWREEPKPRSTVGNVVEMFTGGQQETHTVYHLWTRDTYYKLDAKGREVESPVPNTLGRLPVVALRLGLPVGSYYLDGIGGDLYDATLEVCALKTCQNRSFRDTFKQLVISGVVDPEKVPQSQVMGNPALPILIGDEGTASVLSFDPDLAAMSAMTQEREQGIATKYGISPDSWRMSSQAQSGYAKRLDKGEVLRRNRDDRKWLGAAECELYRLCALISSQEGTAGIPGVGRLDPLAEYVVDFAEPRFDEAPAEQVRADAQRVSLGIASVLDLVMRDNPDLTEEEAVKLLARNRLVNQRFLDTKSTTLLELLAAPPGGGGGSPGGSGQPGGAAAESGGERA